jgi:outer membrane biosynthesis protein TonB
MSKDARFWRNVSLIALAHIAFLVALVRWSLQTRSPSNAQSIVWIGNVQDGAEAKSAALSLEKAPTPPAEPTSLKLDEPETEKPLLTAAKSEIQLPTPKPAPTATTPPKPTPKPKATPKKVALAKASPKSSPKVKPSPADSSGQDKESELNAPKKKIAKTAPAKKQPASHPSDGKGSSAGTSGEHAGGGSSASEFGWYGNMLHDRFYSAWIQPTTNVTSSAKISTLVKVRIEKDGRVSNFEIIKPSENVVVNESVAAIAKRVTEVDPLPAGLGSGEHYDVKINFELNSEGAMAR